MPTYRHALLTNSEVSDTLVRFITPTPDWVRIDPDLMCSSLRLTVQFSPSVDLTQGGGVEQPTRLVHSIPEEMLEDRPDTWIEIAAVEISKAYLALAGLATDQADQLNSLIYAWRRSQSIPGWSTTVAVPSEPPGSLFEHLVGTQGFTGETYHPPADPIVTWVTEPMVPRSGSLFEHLCEDW